MFCGASCFGSRLSSLEARAMLPPATATRDELRDELEELSFEVVELRHKLRDSEAETSRLQSEVVRLRHRTLDAEAAKAFKKPARPRVGGRDHKQHHLGALHVHGRKASATHMTSSLVSLCGLGVVDASCCVVWPPSVVCFGRLLASQYMYFVRIHRYCPCDPVTER